MTTRSALSMLATLTVLAATTAGCGGSGSSPGVADIAGTTTTTSSGAESFGSAPGSGGGGGGTPHFALKLNATGATAEKYAACIRAHGVPSFPDPNAEGVITGGESGGFNPGSPAFQRAQQVCRKLLPNGGQPSPEQIAKAQQSALAFSKCMRAHGVNDFPDPQISDGGIRLSLRGGPGSDLNPTNPTFRRAQQACQGKLGVKGVGGPFGAKG
jgi:hypothetical protein